MENSENIKKKKKKSVQKAKGRLQLMLVLREFLAFGKRRIYKIASKIGHSL